MEEFLRRGYILGIVTVLIIFTAVIGPSFTAATTYQNKASANLTVWDITDNYWNGPAIKYTMPSEVHTECAKFTFQWEINLYANYTNTTNEAIDSSDGSCMIRLDRNNDDDYGDTNEFWQNMSFNLSSGLWENVTNMTYDGTIKFEINCTSALYSDINLTDNVSINNTGPCIYGRVGGISTNPLPDITCYEDTVCSYDFKENCTDDDLNDISGLVYTHDVDPAYSSYFSMTTGVLDLDMTDNENITTITVDLMVEDETTQTSTSMNITVNPVNDAPIFSTLPTEAIEDLEFNATANPEAVITATDEEGHTPFKFNLTVLSCQKAAWIEYPTDNCSVFNHTITSDNMSIDNFTPTNWDVGSYEVNFTVVDSGSEYPQFDYNSTLYSVVWFNVTNVNDVPSIIPINSSDVQLSQGEILYLEFNGTDIENDTLSFNSVTMQWNESNSSYYVISNSTMFPMSTNNTYYPNVTSSGVMNITLTNDYVGNYTLNITLTDNGTNPLNQSSYTYVNLTILNVNDPPELVDIDTNLTYAVQELPYTYDFNATDIDFDTVYSDNLTFGLGFVSCQTPVGMECSIESNSTFSVTKTGNTSAQLFIYAQRNDTGNYTLNLTVTDSGGIINYTYAGIYIVTDEEPEFDGTTQLNGVQGGSLIYTFNVTDIENDDIQLGNVTFYRNLTMLPINLFQVTNDSSGYPPYINLTVNYSSLSNEQVGNYTVEINATDIWNRTGSHYINFSIQNINDIPAINNFTSCDGSEQYGINMTLSENTDYCIILYDADPDLRVPNDFYDENVTYDIEFLGCTSTEDYYPSGNCTGIYFIDIDNSTGEMNFTPVNETWHGNYTYNITIFDSENETASEILNFTILPMNDPPVLHNMSSFLNISAEEPFTYQINATDEEDNLPFTYDVEFDPTALFTINSTTGYVNFTPQLSDVGNYTMNFTVTDAGNATFNYTNATGKSHSNVTVNIAYHLPVITLLSSASFDMIEGTINDFFYRASDILDNDTLTCYWYINGSLIVPDDTLSQAVENSIYNCNTSGGSEIWQYPVTYEDALNLTLGTANITLVVVDAQNFTDSASIIMNVNGSNRAPRLNQSLQSPVKWYNSMNIEPFNLDEYFIDDYGETLNYTYAVGAHMSVSIAEDRDNVTLMPEGGWFGTSWVIFYAHDTPYNASSTFNTSSNNVTLIVQYQEPIEVRIPRTVFRPKIASLQIIVDEIIRVPAQNTSTAKVKFYNDGGYVLYNVNLSALINETNITLLLRDNFLPTLEIGENFTTIMNITIGDLSEGETYTGYVHADAINPSLHERTAFSIKITPSNSTKVIIKIVMIKDLFEENPECMDLFGLIVEAEKLIDENKLTEASELAQLAIDNCQDMIDYAKLNKNETGGSGTPTITGQILLNPLFVMGFVIALISLAMIGYYFMAKRFTMQAKSKKLVAE